MIPVPGSIFEPTAASVPHFEPVLGTVKKNPFLDSFAEIKVSSRGNTVLLSVIPSNKGNKERG